MEKEQNQTFEDKIEEAKKLLDMLVKPDITLSQSVKVYKNGLKQLEEAQKLLDEAKLHYSSVEDIK